MPNFTVVKAWFPKYVDFDNFNILAPCGHIPCAIDEFFCTL